MANEIDEILASAARIIMRELARKNELRGIERKAIKQHPAGVRIEVLISISPDADEEAVRNIFGVHQELRRQEELKRLSELVAAGASIEDIAKIDTV